MSRNKIRKLLQLLLLPPLVAACAGAPPIPEDRFYRLLAPPPPPRLETPAISGTLKVEPIDTFGIYRDRALLYTRSDAPSDIRQYHYHHWIDAPTRLIRDQLVDYLRASGVAGSVVGSQIDLGGNIRLHLTLKNFERELNPSGEVKVKVRLDALITDASNHTLKLASYVREPLAGDSSITTTMAAFSRALGGIYAELLRDLRTL